MSPEGIKLTEVKEYLLRLGIPFEHDVEINNATGRRIPVGGKYIGGFINCFNTGTVDTQGSGEYLSELKELISKEFPKKKR